MHLNNILGNPKILDQDHGSTMPGPVSLGNVLRARQNPCHIRRRIETRPAGILRSDDIRPALTFGIRASGGTSGTRICLMRKFMTEDERPGIRGHFPCGSRMDGHHPAGRGAMDSCQRAVLTVGKLQLATNHESAGLGNHARHPIKLPNTEGSTVAGVGKPARMSFLPRRHGRAKQNHHEKGK